MDNIVIWKKAFVIILGKSCNSYQKALDKLTQERLEDKRAELSLKFAIKCDQCNPANRRTSWG